MEFFFDWKGKLNRFDEFLYFFNFNDALFEDSKHVGNKTDMLFSNVESAEVCESRFKGAFVILEDSLLRDFEILADDGWWGFFFHLQARGDLLILIDWFNNIIRLSKYIEKSNCLKMCYVE